MRHMLRPHVGARPSASSALEHWKLNEASGNAVAWVGGYTLTAYGSPGAAGSLFAVPSGTTGARTFDGSTQYFSGTGDATALAALQAEFTVSAVFVNDTLSGFDAIFCYMGPSNGVSADNTQFYLLTSGSEILVFWEYGSGTDVISTTSGAGLVAGEKYLIVASVYNDTSTTRGVNVWIFADDGTLAFSQNFTGLTPADGGSNSDFFIGRNGRGSEYWDGTIDDVVVWNQALTLDAAYMLSAETFGVDYDEETLYDRGTETHHLRVRVANSAGTLVDMTDLAHGQDVVVSADVSDDIDSPGAQASVSFMREMDSEANPAGEMRWSLAHDVQKSPLNLVGGAFSPLLTLTRRILIDTAVIPEGDTPSEFDWVPLFDGYISAVDWGSDEVTVECTDRIGPLFDVFISQAPLTITSIDDNGGSGRVDVVTSTPHGLSQGDVFKVYNTTNYNGSYTVRSVLSTTSVRSEETLSGSLASESSGLLSPPDVATYGSSGGTPIETVIQDIIDNNVPPISGYIGGTPTLYTPTSPSFDLLPDYQQREPVQTAIENLALMIGWTCKYRWDPEIRTHRLTLLEPDRSNNTPDYTFTINEIIDFSQASIDSKDIRNVVELTFSDSNGIQDGAGQYPRVTIRKQDSVSIAQYGYRICQIAEASTSQIDTFAEASDLADAILSDLADPKATITAEIPLRRFVQLGDLYRIPADEYHWTAAKDVAVVGYAHSFSDGRATTTLTLRGQPAAASRLWTIRMVAPGGPPSQPTTPPLVPAAAPTLSALAGGVAIASPWPLDDLRGRNIDQMELHQSTTLNFIPNASTLRETIRSNRTELHNLDPSVTHYFRTRYRDRFGNYSPWSAQASTKPRYALAIPMARVYRSASAQDLGYATNLPVTDTVIQFNSKAFDTRTNYALAPDYWWECPVDGIYAVDAMVRIEFTSANSANDARIQVYRENNTPAVVLQGATYTEIQHTIFANCDVEGLIQASQGDRFQIRITTNGKGSQTTFGAANASTTYVSFSLVSQDDPP